MLYPCNKLLIGFLLHKKGHLSPASCNKILTPLNIFRSFELCTLSIIRLNLLLILKIKTLFLKIIFSDWLNDHKQKVYQAVLLQSSCPSFAHRNSGTMTD